MARRHPCSRASRCIVLVLAGCVCTQSTRWRLIALVQPASHGVRASISQRVRRHAKKRKYKQDCEREPWCAYEGLDDALTENSVASIRQAYKSLGAESFYSTCGSRYHNPSEHHLQNTLPRALDIWERQGLLDRPEWEDDGHPLKSVLDLACGSGEATLVLQDWAQSRPGALDIVEAADPYTYDAYEVRTGRRARRWSFQDIAAGHVLEGRPIFDAVVCSFCLHLLDESSLFDTLRSLALASRLLIIASPLTKPVVKPKTGWALLSQVPVDWTPPSLRVALYRSVHHGGILGYG